MNSYKLSRAAHHLPPIHGRCVVFRHHQAGWKLEDTPELEPHLTLFIDDSKRVVVSPKAAVFVEGGPLCVDTNRFQWAPNR